MLTGPQLMAAALIEADATNKAQAVQIEAMQDDVAAHDHLTKADGSLNVTEAAKNLGMRPKDLFEWLSHNGWRITVQITNRRGPGPLNLLVDSTGIKFLGDGEWLARKHGTHRRRQYRKVHLAMDTATGDILAVEFTSSREGDSPVLPELLNQIPPDEEIGTVTGDGAFDTRRCHTAILDRGGTAIIPIRRNGRLWKEDCPAARARNDILRATKRFGRSTWKQWTGYHVRSRIEAKMRCLKSFGERIASRDPDRQTAEIQIRIALMNRFNALGTAEIEPVT